MNSLSPALLQRLLQRSNIDSGSEETDLSVAVPSDKQPSKPIEPSKTKTVSFAEPSKASDDAEPACQILDHADHKEKDSNAAHNNEESEHDSVHFPQPQQPPDLDPTSETFLQDLHEKYFPSLPSDPDKLEWMQTSKSSTSGYDPSVADVKPKDLRFNFKGELVPPRTASEIPVTAGLHHHGEAPEAAGYTITELVHLGHSSFAPQRCVAFQTLGRLLYRLGKGEFGDSGESGIETVGAEETFGELARGLWREVEREKAIEMLVMESEGKGVDGGKHVSAKTYATEAVWLWQKSGGRRWKAG
jgi:RNA polymerase II-associated protein 1